MELRIFSTDVADSEVQPDQARTKQLFTGVPVQPLNKPAGKSTMLVQLCQQRKKVVAATNEIEGKAVKPVHASQAPPFAPPNTWQLDRLSAGNEVRPLQLDQAPLNSPPSSATLVTFDVSIAGNAVKLLQLFHAPPIRVTWEVSSNGKLVKPEQPLHGPVISVTEEVLMTGKLVSPVQYCHAFLKPVAELVSMLGKLVRLEHPCQAPWFCSPKRTTLEKSSSGKLVKPLQPSHAPAIDPLMPDVSIDGNDVIRLRLRQVPSPLVGLPRFPVAEEKSRAGNVVKDEQLFHVL